MKTMAMATPMMNKKKGITKSAGVIPSQGAWLMDGYMPPASSTRIMICDKNRARSEYQNFANVPYWESKTWRHAPHIQKWQRCAGPRRPTNCVTNVVNFPHTLKLDLYMCCN